MKKAGIFIVAVLVLLLSKADACVGKKLNIGVVNSPEGQVLAEMLSILINERTGTGVDIRFYKNSQELYDAVKVEQVDISFENTTRALRVLNKPLEGDPKKAYDIVKTTYEKEKGLVWLKPFGFLNGDGGGAPSYTAAILRTEVVSNFPALPRVIDKLGGAVTDETHSKLMRSLEAGEKAKKIARDFLKSKKLI